MKTFEHLEPRRPVTSFTHIIDAIPIGDLNGDGYDDLLAVVMPQQLQVYWGYETGLHASRYYKVQLDPSYFGDGGVVQYRIHNAFGADSQETRTGFAADAVFARTIHDWREEDLAFFWEGDPFDGEVVSYPRTDNNYKVSPGGIHQPEPDVWPDNDWYLNDSDFNGDGIQDIVKKTSIGNEDVDIEITYRRDSTRGDRMS